MAKLTKTFENGEIKAVLTFKDKEFVSTMGSWKNGVRTSKEICLYDQIKKAFPKDGLEDYEELGQFDFGDDEEIEEALSILSGEFE